MSGKTQVFGLLAGLFAVFAQADNGKLEVHEWGTFTSFQDERGATIAGINVDDEPVPKFVHRLGDVPIFTRTSLPANWSQGAPRCHRPPGTLPATDRAGVVSGRPGEQRIAVRSQRSEVG